MRYIVLSVLLLFFAAFLSAGTIQLTTDIDYSVEVLRTDQSQTAIEYRIGSFDRFETEIEESLFYHIRMSDGGFSQIAGEPELPYITRSVIIPNAAEMEVAVIAKEYVEIPMRVAPSKGVLFRNQSPQDVPYVFGEVYQGDRFYPEKLATLDSPYIMRDFRGQAIRVFPFQYNPVTEVLRVYTKLVIELNNVGISNENILERSETTYSREFESIYRSHFLNFRELRYTPLQERGSMLVICYDEFLEAIEPYVEWKNQKGIYTEVVPISQIGNNSGQIKSYIQSQYNTNSNLTYVQLIGDAAQIDTPSVRGGGADPVYSLLAGNDNYPDIFVGRFSAENIPQLTTQVEKTIYYEKYSGTEDDWYDLATGIASNEGSNPTDIQHMEGIRNRLLNYNYHTVDQFYQPNATSGQVTSSVNDGRGFINYVGHGSTTAWQTTGFSNTHVNNLSNDYKLPFIVSVACINGNFTTRTCFAEAWLRAKNNTTDAPTGAVAMYASSVNQSWFPPLSAQNEIVDLLTGEQMFTIGGLMFNGSSKMIDDWGHSGAQEFQNWHIFGDASLMVRTKTPEEMFVEHNEVILLGMEYYQVETDTPDALVSLTYESEIIASGYTDSSGIVDLDLRALPVQPLELVLTITAFNKVAYQTPIELLPSEGAFIVINNLTVNGLDEQGKVSYGEELSLNVDLANIGVDPAEDVMVTVTSADPNILIGIEEHYVIDHLSPEETAQISEELVFVVAPNTPDQHRIELTLNVHTSGDEYWHRNFSFVVNAPHLQTGVLSIDDSEYGDENGLFDPGETVTLNIPIINQGHAISPMLEVEVQSFHPMVTIDSPSVQQLGIVFPFESVNSFYSISASEDIEPGTVVSIGVIARAGEYEKQNTYNIRISEETGTPLEDFAEGNFDSYPWEFSGVRGWVIDSSVFFRDGFSAKSGLILHNQTSSMSVTLNIVATGEISFYRRVSSQLNADFLEFYINDELVGQWSGNVNWGRVAFPVQSGNHTFRWTYSKDELLTQGADAAWIDHVQFPPVGTIETEPIISAPSDHLDFGSLYPGESAVRELLLRNFGDHPLIYTIDLPVGFRIQDNEEREEYTIEPSGSLTHTIIFTPDQPGVFDNEMLIESNATNRPTLTILLSGTGIGSSTDEIVGIPLRTELKSNYPNPFNPSTTIMFNLSEKDEVTIEIFDIKGRKIKRLINDSLDQGEHHIFWDGKSDTGQSLPSGIYLYRLQTGNYQQTKRMIMLK